MGKGQTKRINEQAVYNKAMPWWKERIYGPEIMGMRLLRKKSLKEMSRVTGQAIAILKEYEEDNGLFVPPPIAGMYMLYLSCNMNHVYQFRAIVSGQINKFDDNRSIGAELRRQVYKKCNNKCVHCGSKDNLHIHHVVEFAKGGRTELENLVLLCVECHANVHEDNQAYHLLKKQALEVTKDDSAKK